MAARGDCEILDREAGRIEHGDVHELAVVTRLVSTFAEPPGVTLGRRATQWVSTRRRTGYHARFYDQMVVPEAPVERTETGLAPVGEGWLVLNAHEVLLVASRGLVCELRIRG
jgi:hypothetical protein